MDDPEYPSIHWKCFVSWNRDNLIIRIPFMRMQVSFIPTNSSYVCNFIIMWNTNAHVHIFRKIHEIIVVTSQNGLCPLGKSNHHSQ